MNFSVFTQDLATYLQYTVQSQDEIDTVALGMMQNNEIKGLVPMIAAQMDDNQVFRFDITEKQPLQGLASTVINKKHLLAILSDVCDAMLEVEEYMIDSANCLINMEYIYLDNRSGQALVMCLPVVKSDANVASLHTFVKSLVFSMHTDSTEDLGYIGRLINYIGSHDTIDLCDFKGLLEQMSQDVAMAPKSEPTPVEEPVVEVVEEPVVEVVEEPVEEPVAEVVEEPIVAPVEETVVWNQPQQPAQVVSYPYMIRVRTNEKFVIDKPVFRIGKEKSFVDFAITNNSAISRSHADILTNGDQYFVKDMNSTNHTYVNNMLIPSGTEIPIKNGTTVRLADEEFKFCVE